MTFVTWKYGGGVIKIKYYPFRKQHIKVWIALTIVLYKESKAKFSTEANENSVIGGKSNKYIGAPFIY